MDDRKAVLVIKPALVYDISVYELPADSLCRRSLHGVALLQETRFPRSFMYSLGAYLIPLDEEDEKTKYSCLANPTCRETWTMVACRQSDCSKVNTHHKSKELYTFVLYVWYIQNHTWGITQVLSYEELLDVLYDIHTRIRNLCIFCRP